MANPNPLHLIHPYSALCAELEQLVAKPIPVLFEVRIDDDRVRLAQVAIEPTRWTRRGALTVLAELAARVEADPWPYRHAYGHALTHIDDRTPRVWAADRVGSVFTVGYRPSRPPRARRVEAANTPVVAQALRRLALAVNGPISPAKSHANSPVTSTPPKVAPAGACLLVTEAPDRWRPIEETAASVGAVLDTETPDTVDPARWQTTPLVLLAADEPTVLDAAHRWPARPGGLVLLAWDKPVTSATCRAQARLGAEAIATWPADHRWLRARFQAAARHVGGQR